MAAAVSLEWAPQAGPGCPVPPCEEGGLIDIPSTVKRLGSRIKIALSLYEMVQHLDRFKACGVLERVCMLYVRRGSSLCLYERSVKTLKRLGPE